MTAASVVSLPVPAVIGTAIRSGSLCRSLRYLPSWPAVCSGGASLAPTALAQSMEEPPPKARSADIRVPDKDLWLLLYWQKSDLQLYLYILYMKFQILKAVFKGFCKPEFVDPRIGDEQDMGNVMFFRDFRDVFESSRSVPVLCKEEQGVRYENKS